LVGGHADQQVPEPAGRHPSHDPAEGLATPAAAEGLPAGAAGLGEVEVLDCQRAAAVRFGEPEQLGDRGAEPAIAGAGGLPVEVERDRVGLAEWVAGRIEDPGGEVVGVEVDPEAAMLAEFVQRRHWTCREPPGTVKMPAARARAAALERVQADVVPDGTAGGLRRPLASTVGEGHRA